MRLLIVVDMQEDFVNGIFGFPEAREIIEPINKKIKEYHENGDLIIFTQDSHDMPNYEETQEGKVLPPHCLQGTKGHALIKEFDHWMGIYRIEKVEKWNSFALNHEYLFLDLAKYHIAQFDEIELVGLVTNICVLSCAVVMRCTYPFTKITVDASCCRSFDPELHEKALDVMSGLLIDVINR